MIVGGNPAGASDAVTTREIGNRVSVGPAVRLENATNRLALLFTVLDRDHPAPRNMRPGKHADSPDEIETVSAAIESCGRVKASNLRISRHRRIGHIWRVRHDHVELLRPGDPRPSNVIPLDAQILDTESTSVRLGPHESVKGTLDGDDPALGHLGGNGKRDGTGSGAEIKRARFRNATEVIQNRFDEDFGFGSRNENARAHAQGEVTKVGCTGDVLQRLSRRAPRNKTFERTRGRLLHHTAEDHPRHDRLPIVAERKRK